MTNTYNDPTDKDLVTALNPHVNWETRYPESDPYGKAPNSIERRKIAHDASDALTRGIGSCVHSPHPLTGYALTGYVNPA